MKKISIIICLLLISVVLCGCEEKKKDKVIINDEPINTASMEHKHCTREANATSADVSLEYDIYYTGDVLNLLISNEKIISADESILNTYEEAYRSIHKNYEGLENYDASVVRGDTTVTSTIKINYDKVDISKLIQIEGEDDNIFEDNIPKASKWLTLAKKFGTKCELVK